MLGKEKSVSFCWKGVCDYLNAQIYCDLEEGAGKDACFRSLSVERQWEVHFEERIGEIRRREQWEAFFESWLGEVKRKDLFSRLPMGGS